ncbi:MAG: hypothetical protein PHH60_01645 [Candidatus Margulisbacteria bacterium]|nr:hypothetical protein [Candidatus Margulisiibacteriota bacterium]
MKKMVPLFFLLLFVFAPITIAEANIASSGDSATPPPKVLGLTFGATRQQVKNLYINRFKAKPIREKDDALMYLDALVDIPSVYDVVYEFYGDRLAKITVRLDTETTDDSAFLLLSVYNQYKEMLREKYGTPESYEGMDKDYDTDESRLVGLKTGKGCYASLWRTKDLAIDLALEGDAGELGFVLLYEYRPLYKKLLEERKKKTTESL